jgi:ribosomal protein S27E
MPSVPASAMEVPADAGVQVTPRALMPAAVNHSNRVKFTCLGCGLNVWGKPSVRVACIGCELELMAMETTRETAALA